MRHTFVSGLRSPKFLAYFVFAVLLSSTAILQAQSSLPSDAQGAPAMSPGDMAPSIAGGPLNQTGTDTAASGHGPGASAGYAPSSAQWNRLILDFFQMGLMRFSHASGNSPDRLGSAGPTGSRLGQDIRQGFGQDFGKGFDSAPIGGNGMPNQMRTGGLQFSSQFSMGNFQFQYRDQLGQGANAMGGEMGYGSAQASYNARSLKHDLLHFSATTTFGGMDSGFRASDMGNSYFGSSGTNGTSGFSSGSMNGAGIGSNSGGFMSGSNMGGPGMNGSGMNGSGRGSMDGPQGGMRGGNGGQRGSGSGPTLSLKLSF